MNSGSDSTAQLSTDSCTSGSTRPILQGLIAASSGQQLPHPALIRERSELKPYYIPESLQLSSFPWTSIQHESIHRAVFSPDCLLLQGETGTGLTQTVNEILLQLQLRGERVLVLASTSDCQARFYEKITEAVRENSWFESRSDELERFKKNRLAKTVDASIQTKLEELSQFETLLNELDSLLEDANKLQQEVALLEEEREKYQGQVPTLDLPACLLSLQSQWESFQAELSQQQLQWENERESLQNQLNQELSKANQLELQQSEVAPLVEALEAGRWWSTAYWRARLERDSLQKRHEEQGKLLQSTRAHCEAVQTELKECESRFTEGFQQHHQVRCQSWIESHKSENVSRVEKEISDLRNRISTLDAQSHRLQSQLSGMTHESIRATRESLQNQLTIAAQRQESIQAISEIEASRLSALVSLPQFSMEKGIVEQFGPFDRIVIWEVERATENDWQSWLCISGRFLFLQRNEQIREPHKPPRGNQSGNTHLKELWAIASDLGWREEQGRVIVRLCPVSGEMDSETVIDDPEVELRLLRSTMQLAEVAFPAQRPFVEIKRFLHRELDEIRIDPISLRLHEQDHEGTLGIRFGDSTEGDRIEYSNGITEVVRERKTVGIEWNRSNWSEEQASQWLREQISLTVLGRVCSLKTQHRQELILSQTSQFLITGDAIDPPIPREVRPSIQFIPVPERGFRRELDSFEKPGIRHRGAGCEVDLSDPAARLTLTTEEAMELPSEGIINPLEVERIVDFLNRQRDISQYGIGCTFDAQCELLRKTLQLNERLQSIPVGNEAFWRTRECKTLLISLTRSHPNRAVPFAADPTILFDLMRRARSMLILFGDVGTMLRRTQWSGPCEYLNGHRAEVERQFLRRLIGQLVMGREETLVEIGTDRSTRPIRSLSSN
jgi:hypothetical protein